MRDVVGRDAELARASRWIDGLGVPAGPQVLAITGEAGIGKTTLVTDVIESARASGAMVLSATGSSSEMRLSYTALADLLAPVADRIVELPGPQHDALARALLIDRYAGQRVDLRAAATGTRSLLAIIASERPIVIAVDDGQWIDSSTTQALQFLRRRLPARVGLLGASRSGSARAAPAPWGDPDLEISLGPLNLASIHHILRRELGTAPPRPALIRIERMSLGNPIAAVELARRDSDDVLSDRVVEVSELLARRMRKLPRRCRHELLVLAAAGTDAHVDAAALRPARDSRLLAEGVPVRFAHPLYATTVLDSADPEERHSVHRWLAAVSVDDEERARHLALAADGPDEAVAIAADRAAVSLRDRAVIVGALELAELAVERSDPSSPQISARFLLVSELAFQLGDTDRARRAAGAAAGGERGHDRARAELQLARIAHEAGSSRDAVAHAQAAVRLSDGDAPLTAEAYAVLALVNYDDFEQAGRDAERALTTLSEIEQPHPSIEALALMARAEAQVYAGRGLDVGAFERAIELERIEPPIRIADRASSALGAWLKYCDDLDGSRRLLLAARDDALAEGDDSSLTYAVSHLPQLELWAGDLVASERWAREHLELAAQMGQDAQRIQALLNLGQVLVWKGEREQATRTLDAGLALAGAGSDSYFMVAIRAVQGALAFVEGRYTETVELLTESDRLRDAINLGEPGLRRQQGELIESLVHLGRLDEAHAVADGLERAGLVAGRRSTIAQAQRGRAVALAAAGHYEAACTMARHSARCYADLGMPIEAARAALVEGGIERRARRRARARAQLEFAAAEFARLGVRLWELKARDELARLGGQRGDPNELTESERRIAVLAASGLTTRQVAEALFISPKTVEAHLGRAYRKLGVSSRAELGARFGER